MRTLLDVLTIENYKASRRHSLFKLNVGSTEINGTSGMLKIRHLFKCCGRLKPLCNTASP